CGISEQIDNWPPLDFLCHSLIENWQQGKFGLHYHIETSRRLLNRPAGKHCARFENPVKDLMLNGRTRLIENIHVDSRCGGSGRQDAAMLVPIINHLDLPEEFGFRPLPAMVWLQTLDECPYGAANTAPYARHHMGGTTPDFPDEMLGTF